MPKLPGYLPGLGPGRNPVEDTPVCRLCERPGGTTHLSVHEHKEYDPWAGTGVKLMWSEFGLLCGPCYEMLATH